VAQMSTTQENKPSSILVVDDEADIVDVFKQALQQYSFDVSGYTDPLQALEHFRNYPNHYFLVISDIRMPKMNGFEFVKMVKGIKPEVKVFLMTAFEINQAEFRRVLASIKIDEFIQKPIPLKKLYWLVRKYVY
jgi:DNA-binding NtrC family response regulator